MNEPEITSTSIKYQRRVAYHEAGHAVAAVRLNIPFMHVVVNGDTSSEVEVSVTPLDNEDGLQSSEEMRRWQQFYAAGAASEQLLFGYYLPPASSRDRREHDEYEKRSHAPRVDGWYQDIAATVAVLDRESVKLVARELKERGRLEEDQVYEILHCDPP